MTRVKRGTVVKKRHKALLKLTKGFWGERKNLFKKAKDTLLRAWAYAFKGRKLKKRDMRALFISRVKAAANNNGLAYNALIYRLKIENVLINRKMLSQLAIAEPTAFTELVNLVKG
ncbi:MAG: 50S ribosomal protein L20 [Candidatus Dependentiae bacterium]|nr:50S ribosomal protein L20 [Candidatus Dependentiae bacterium]